MPDLEVFAQRVLQHGGGARKERLADEGDRDLTGTPQLVRTECVWRRPPFAGWDTEEGIGEQ